MISNTYKLVCVQKRILFTEILLSANAPKTFKKNYKTCGITAVPTVLQRIMELNGTALSQISLCK